MWAWSSVVEMSISRACRSPDARHASADFLPRAARSRSSSRRRSSMRSSIRRRRSSAASPPRFCAGFDSYRDRDAVTELRWDFEELRVAVFAPELKTAWPVSLAGVTSALAVLK